MIPFQTHGGWPGHVMKDMKKVCKGAAFSHEMKVQFKCISGWRKNEAFAKYFTGQSYLNMLTIGRGYYQEWVKEAQELHPGSVVAISAEVKHWHGAAPDSCLERIRKDQLW